MAKLPSKFLMQVDALKAEVLAIRADRDKFISQNVFIKSFCKSQLPHKSVNFSQHKESVDGFCLGIDFGKMTL